MRSLLLAVAVWTLAHSTMGFASERVNVQVEYRHDEVEVHYTFAATYGQLATLTSLPDAPTSWKIAVTPTRSGADAIKVKVSVTEDGKLISSGTIIVSAGQSATMRSEGDDGVSELRIVATPGSR